MNKGSLNIYDKIVPKDSFIGRYLDMMADIETPKMYDFWSAVWILSSLIGRSCVIDRPSIPLFMNFYIIFMAESGICRKSTAVNTAYDIFEEIYDKNTTKLINSATNLQGFWCLFQPSLQNNNVCVNVAEFISFFKNKKIIEMFTDLYDCPRKRKGYDGKNEYELNNIFINLLAASTPSYYFSAVSGEQLEGGFSGRTIVLPASSTKKKIGWKDKDPEARERVIEKGKEILQKIPVCITLNKSAVKYFREHYRRSRNPTGRYAAFHARQHDFAIKLSGILAINRFASEISKEDVQNAYKIISMQQKATELYYKHQIFTQTDTELEDTIELVRKCLIQAGSVGIKHSALYNKVRHRISKDDFTSLISIMHELGLLDKYAYREGSALLYLANPRTLTFEVRTVLSSYGKVQCL